ncbi:hypothetical protein BDDG_12068 [Blastomyces dermatitidis ATCC 18188]|uniref:Uncharacterized protein n=2 Tax=Ajellomyces dermatitidis TaxID=5039 RepID=A0A0J9ELY5_AJEDA|nr:hypothetical protein BDDG_12068 [Blastomyces dermatitidis ATCC 18188]
MRTEYTASTKSCSCVSSTRVARLHRGKLDQPKIHDLLGFTTPWVPSFIPPQERNSLSQDPYLQCYVRIQIFTGPHDDRQSNGSVELRGWLKSQPHTTAYTSTLLRPRRPRIDGFNFAAALKECAPNTLYSMMNGLFCSAFRVRYHQQPEIIKQAHRDAQAAILQLFPFFRKRSKVNTTSLQQGILEATPRFRHKPHLKL